MKRQFLEASNLFRVSFLILDGPPPLKLVLISPSSCCALKPPVLGEADSTEVSQQNQSLWKWKPSGAPQF